MQVGLAEHDGAGIEQPLQHRRVGARPHVAQCRRAAGRRQVAAVDVVLDDDRQAGERRHGGAAAPHGVDAQGLRRRAGAVEGDEGVEVLQALGPVERRDDVALGRHAPGRIAATTSEELIA